MNKKVLVGLLSAVLVSGCVSMSDDPYIRSLGNDPQSTELNDELTNKRLSYIGRYLVETETRREIVANTYNKEFIESWSSADYGTMTSMVTDLAVGDLGSSLGSDLGAAVSIGGMVLGAAFSSDYDIVGQAWLPDDFNGASIDSSDEAHQVFSQFINKKIGDVAAQFNYEATCLGRCGERSKAFLLERKDAVENHPQWGYQPEQIVALIHIPVEFEAVEENDILPVIIGEPVRWKLPPYFTLKMGFYSAIQTDENGDVVVQATPTEKGYTIETVSTRRDLLKVPLGRMMMQSFHDTPYTFYATDDEYPSQLYFNGKAYRFFDGSQPQIIEEEITKQWGG